MHKRLVLLPSLLWVALASLTAQTPESVSVSSSAQVVSARPAAGDLAPDFTVLGADNKEVKLSDFRGKVVIVDVSATWCGPCQAAMPNNDRIARKYADQGVVLLGVTADDSRESYDSWLKRNEGKYAFPMTFDPAGREGWKTSVFNLKYGITGFPSMYVIGRDGKIVETISGGGPGEDHRLEYALSRAGVKVDLASLPPEPKKDPSAPKFIPAVTKTPARPAGGGAADLIPQKFGSVAAGEPVPAFKVVGPDGKNVSPADFAGKPLVVQFVTAGGPQPWLLELLNTYRSQGLEALVVFAATERAAFDAWLAKNPERPYAVAWDPAGKAWAEGVANTNFGIGMFPATFVAAPDGKLVSGAIGMGERAVVSVKMMLIGTRAIKPTEADLAQIRTLIQTLRPAGGMAAARPSSPGGAEAAPVATLAAGAVAPDFVSLTLDKREVKLADFKDKIVILDFWATWCGPCMASLPHTQELAEKYKDQGVVVLASCTSDTRAKFEEWVKANQAKYPGIVFASDPNERGSKTFEERASSKLYHVQGIPTQFVIGRDGKIAATLVGFMGKDDARAEAALASLGVKVADELVAKGNEQLKKDAAENAARAAKAAEEAKNPPAPFRENFGKLKAGEVAPDFEVTDASGAVTTFSALAKGRAVVLGLWSAAGGPPPPLLEQWEAWSRAYAAQNVVFVGLAAFGAREEADAWRAANAGKFTFPLVFDPSGKAPKPPKPASEMNEEEKKAFGAEQKAYYGSLIPMKLGGVITPVPSMLVFDADRKLVGWSAGFGSNSSGALGNLLLRAGVKLLPEHTPARVYTHEETKPEPASQGPGKALLKAGVPAPDFVTQTLEGKDVKISDFRGKVLVLDFWATWCGPCMASLPHTQEVAAKYKDQGIAVLGSCTSDTRAKFEEWVKANQAKYPDIVWTHDKAERGATRASAALYGVAGIPTQFVIGRDGAIVAVLVGYRDGDSRLEGALAKAGMKVDPAIVAKAAKDQAEMSGP